MDKKRTGKLKLILLQIDEKILNKYKTRCNEAGIKLWKPVEEFMKKYSKQEGEN